MIVKSGLVVAKCRVFRVCFVSAFVVFLVACGGDVGSGTEMSSSSSIGSLDADMDGVDDAVDLCPNTTPGAQKIDDDGCLVEHITDSDMDGVEESEDNCPDTLAGKNVNSVGCALSQLDSDSDNVNDAMDACPGSPSGVKVDTTGCELAMGDAIAMLYGDQCAGCHEPDGSGYGRSPDIRGKTVADMRAARGSSMKAVMNVLTNEEAEAIGEMISKW